ncbi:hypothetical protein IW262DRAFT_1461805 [Armillaria fumosa]|nr:hypothetical protein IW262DRAFT_1461805 [Armillaria fumosa]
MPNAMEGPTPDMSQDDMKAIVDNLGMGLNLIILQSLLHGESAHPVTLWTTYTSTKRAHDTFLSTIIILLYLLSTMAFAISWVFERRAFIQYGYNYYSVFSAFTDDSPWWSACYLVSSITSGISTILVDVTLIWRCWTLWVHRWWVILLPMMCAVVGTVMKGMQTYSDIHILHLSDSIGLNEYVAQIDWPLIYSLMTLATNLMCTLLIVYRIISFARIFSFRSVISAMIESSAIYSLAMIVYLVLVGRDLLSASYADIIVGYSKGIAPTFLMLRVATGSTASFDDESTNSRPLSDINFRPMRDDDTSSSNPSDQSVSESHGTRTTESV